MENNEKKELKKYLYDEKIHWESKAIDQLGFVNYLILTLSIAYVSYTFNNFSEIDLVFSIENIDFNLTFLMFSFGLMIFSSFLGGLVIFSRLADFRITRQIRRIQYNILKHAGDEMDNKTEKRIGNYYGRFFIVLKILNSKQPKILITESKNYSNYDNSQKKLIDERYKRLRNCSYNCGIFTWQSVLFQIISFFLSMFFLFVSIIEYKLIFLVLIAFISFIIIIGYCLNKSCEIK